MAHWVNSGPATPDPDGYVDEVRLRCDAALEHADGPVDAAARLDEVWAGHVADPARAALPPVFTAERLRCLERAEQRLLSDLAAAAGDLPADELERLRTRGNNRLLEAEARASAAMGAQGVLMADLDLARREYEDAANAFTQLAGLADPGFGVHARLCQAEGAAAEGRQSFARGRAADAAEAYMRAAALAGSAETLLHEALGRRPDEELRSMQRYLPAGSTVHRLRFEDASLRDRLLHDDPEAAVAHAQAAVEAAEQALAGEGFAPPGYREYLRVMSLAAQAQRARAQGRLSRRDGHWEQSHLHYARARALFLEAAGAAVCSGSPDARDQQAALMTEATLGVDVELRECRNEQRLREEIAQLSGMRDELISRLRSTGATINNQVEATAVAEAHAEVVVRLEQQVRQTLPAVAAALQEDGSPEAQGLAARLGDIERSEATGTRFIDRLRSWTQDAADLVQTAAKVAGPLYTAVKPLAFLLGVPLP